MFANPIIKVFIIPFKAKTLTCPFPRANCAITCVKICNNSKRANNVTEPSNSPTIFSKGVMIIPINILPRVKAIEFETTTALSISFSKA